jgi:hypothetical protein
MTTQYTTILKLALPVQGELSGTWGDVVNDNITQMVEQAIAGKATINSWTANAHTLTTADGTTSESRCAILELTDTGTALTGAGTVTCPTNTKLYIVDNNTAEIITIKTAAGTGVAVPVGKTMLVYCDGTNVVEGVTHANSLSLGTSTVTVDSVLDQDDMSSDSATALATQQSIKAYVDSQVGTVDTLAEILANGNTTGANDIEVDTTQKVQFRDADIYLNSSVDGQLDIVADTEIQIAATTVDLNGNLDVSGTALVAGVLTTTAATVFNGGFASNADSTLGTDKKVQFRDTAIYLNSSVDGQLDIVADGEVQIDTALVDINGNLDVSGTTNISGSTTFTKNAIAGVAISTIARASNTVTVTNSAVHGLTNGDLVNINGVANRSFNGYFTVAVSSTTVFTYSQIGADESSTGGTSTEIVYNLNASGTALNWMNGPLNIAANSGIDGLEITQSGSGEALSITGGNALFGDNDKAIFGIGNDLQIYHTPTGNHSIIAESGAGNLILAADNLEINNAANNANKIVAATGGAVTLYYNNSAKLATTATGIDVTGTATANNLTLSNVAGVTSINVNAPQYSSSWTLFSGAGGANAIGFWDGSAYRLTVNPSGIDVTGTATMDGLTVDGSATIQASSSPALIVKDTTNNVEARLQAFNSTATVGTQSNHSFSIETNDTNRALFASNGDISFYEDTGTTPKLFWDASAESLGIGTSSPVSSLDLSGGADGTIGAITLAQGNTTSKVAKIYGTSVNTNEKGIRFNTYHYGDVDAVTITSDGSVGIGTSSPSTSLDVVRAGVQPLRLQSTSGTEVSINMVNTGGNVQLEAHSGNFSIDADAVGIGTSSPDSGYKLDVAGNVAFGDGGGFDMNVDGTRWQFSLGGSEKMRLDASGNLLVGKTSTTFSVVGVENRADGRITSTRSGNTNLLLNRLSSDGDIAQFYKDGSSVGSIATNSSRFELDGSGNPVRMKAGTSNIQVNNNTHISFDTAGGEAARFDANANLLVGTTSVINTGVVSVEFTGASQNGISIKTTTASNGSKFLSFADSAGTEIGYIEENTSTSVNYSTSSDQRLKDNIVDAPSASDDIDAIQVRSFDWKSNGSHQKYGMVAQELQTVAPEAVSGDADSEEMMGVDYSKLVPMMLKEIQSLRARVAQLES